MLSLLIKNSVLFIGKALTNFAPKTKAESVSLETLNHNKNNKYEFGYLTINILFSAVVKFFPMLTNDCKLEDANHFQDGVSIMSKILNSMQSVKPGGN
jgi:hypothetical protein